MRISARANLPEVFAALDTWVADVTKVAAPRALNKLRDQAETAGLRKLASIYGIGPRTMEKYISTTIAKPGDSQCSIISRGRGFPLMLFNPRVVRGKGGGVSVQVKSGKRFLIPHAFIATMKSGHQGVFARGSYGGKGDVVKAGTFGRFVFGKRRVPISELFTLTPAGAFSNPDVTAAMTDRVAAQLPIVLAQEIRFATR